MNRVICGVLVAIVACACPSKATKTGSGSGSGTTIGSAGSGTVAPPTGGCDGAKAKVEQLYRAEAQAKAVTNVEEAVSDNTAMVMADCKKAPAKVSACIAGISTVKDLEATCLVQLDDEGTEGDADKH
jgi:hypothetical protein